MTTSSTLCPDAVLSDLVANLQGRPESALDRVATAAGTYPADGRLQFLYGSMLAGSKRYAEALGIMARAVELAPYFWIARFQLGLLQLTLGEPDRAAETWRPLHELSDDHPLTTLATGLEALISDDIPETIRLLRLGIERNHDNVPLNRDMQMLIDKLRDGSPDGAADSGADEPTSAVQMLLKQYGGKPTKH